jgi:hypothetical protein
LVPANLQANRSNLVRLSWQESLGASNYRVLAQVPPANTTIFDGLVGNVTEVSGAVNPATPFLLSVSAINACGQSPLSLPVSLAAGGGPIPCVPDIQTMCLLDRRFTVRLTLQPPGGIAGPVDVLRRFNDGGGFSFVSATNVEDLLMRIENRCATEGVYVVSFNNRSGFRPAPGSSCSSATTAAASAAASCTHPARNSSRSRTPRASIRARDRACDRRERRAPTIMASR